MCNQACIDFAKAYLSEDDVKRKDVIEVGAFDVNGSLRSVVEALQPARYTGVDIKPGKGVDQVCRAENLVRRFGNSSFDVIICTELVEHIRNWKTAISNFKNILRPKGIIIITTRSKGFGYHGFPFDFWRYEISDLESIFSDFVIETAQKDPEMLGVFVKARKPKNFIENNLDKYELYSIEFNRKSTIVESSLYFPLFFAIRIISKEWPERFKQTEAYKKFKIWKKSIF